MKSSKEMVECRECHGEGEITIELLTCACGETFDADEQKGIAEQHESTCVVARDARADDLLAWLAWADYEREALRRGEVPYFLADDAAEAA